jgi:phenylacetic acid degradation operon negative regulatory protein
VVAWRAQVQFLEALDLLGQAILTRGRAFAWQSMFPSREAYYGAVARLKKRGLIVSEPGKGEPRRLSLTSEGEAALSDIQRPERYWGRRWKGIWYVLLYDVPETERAYRDALRAFLQRMRMGCLQRSVWISPTDIRPEYSDLQETTSLRSYAVLFESRTVLGMRTDDIVDAAWDMMRVSEGHSWFMARCEERLEKMTRIPPEPSEAITLAREELNAYRAVMAVDPLLPRGLWPPSYAGERVYAMHRSFQAALSQFI